MTLPGGTRRAAATTSGRSAVRSLNPRSFRCTAPPGSRNRIIRNPSHLTSKRYSGELKGASAEAACIGRTSSGKLSSSIWSWSESAWLTPPRLGERALGSLTPPLSGLGRGLFLLGLLRTLLLGLFDRLAQRLHQVHDLRGLRSLRGFDDLAFHLGVDDLHHSLFVLVLVALGIEAVGEALDQGLGHLELLGVDLHLVLETFEALGRADLVGPVQRVHDQAFAVRVQRAEVLLVAPFDVAVGDLVVALRTPARVGDGGGVLGAQLEERHLGGRFGCIVEANRDRDHSERDHAFPHRSRHGDAVYLLCTGLATFGKPARVTGRRPASASRVSSFRLPRPRAGA